MVKNKKIDLQKILLSFRFIYLAITFSLDNRNSWSCLLWLFRAFHRFNCLVRQYLKHTGW